MSRTTLRLAVLGFVLAATPALAQVRPPAPPPPPPPPMWDEAVGLSARDRATVEHALREAEAAMREAMIEVGREMRDVNRQLRDVGRDLRTDLRSNLGTDKRWMARTWAESQARRRGPEQTERIAQSFKVGANGTLVLGNVAGDITIEPAPGDTIAVEAIKRTRGDAADEFARTQVQMNERAGRVEVRVVYSGQQNHASVDFNVTAPPGTTLAIRSVSGDVRITGIRGDVRAESVSGDVNAVDVPGASFLKSVSGDIDVSAVSHQAELRVESVSGDVVVRDAQVRGLTAETVSGDLRLTDVSGERVAGKSVSGGVDFSGPLTPGGRYELRSHSGDIRMGIANNAGFELEATTFSGNVRSDLPLTFGGPGREAVRTTGRPGRQALRGVHGDGSAFVSLSSFSGTIVVGK